MPARLGDQKDIFLKSVLQKHASLLIFHATPVVPWGQLRQPWLLGSRFGSVSVLEASVNLANCPSRAKQIAHQREKNAQV